MSGIDAPLIEVRHLKRYFGSSDKPVRAVDDVSFAIRAGETLGLVGESGSGKSTIGRTVLRLIERTGGEVLYRGEDLAALSAERMRRLRSKLQIIFQDPYASLNPKMRISAILDEALSTHGLAKGRRKERIAELLDLVGLRPEHASRFPHEFSGGQRQRIGIARALAVEPEFIVADEPLSALDVSIQAQVINLLADLRERLSLTMLFISHDLDVVEYLCDRVVVLYLGHVMEVATTAELFARPLHPYTQALLAASPKPDPLDKTEIIPLKGDIPSPMDPPSGCVFRTRCPKAMEACAQTIPRLEEKAPGRFSACILSSPDADPGPTDEPADTTMTNDLIDPLLQPGLKGYPLTAAPRRRSEVAAAGWNVLAGDLPLPLALLKREALEHNIAWMQQRTQAWGIQLAPHGKTTMSPQLFRRQLDAGAWGLTFATVNQLAIGVAAGARRTLIANQVVHEADLAAIQALLRGHAGLRIVFLVDSIAQLELIEAWAAAHAGALPFEAMLEVGVPGGRSGVRTQPEATALAARMHASRALRLVGIECYEGLGAKGETEADVPYAQALMDRVEAIAKAADAAGWFDTDEVLLSAGGSAIFDLVAGRLTPSLTRPVRGLLRSGCYVTHDHGFYKRMVNSVEARLGCGCGETLRPAMEVWAMVQSRPEPGLAILAVGKRDISFDLALPVPIARAARGASSAAAVPAGWAITGLNDQHAYLRWNVQDEGADEAAAPVVGERIGLGISHPCTTFDKWHWMPIVENDYRVSDAVAMHF